MIVNWPKLSDEQIENKAAEFRQQALAALDTKSASAVPVEQIAEHYLGYELEFVEDDSSLPGDVIGGIDFDSNTIIINAAIESHIGRYSFTIAHEIAHHVLHRDIFLKAALVNRLCVVGVSSGRLRSFRPIDLLRHY